MKKYLPIFRKAALFQGINDMDLESMLQCLSAKRSAYQKGQVLVQKGMTMSSVGLVLSGALHLLNDDFWGNRTILAQIVPGELFGETYACVQTAPLQVTVQAAEATEVLYLDIRKIMTLCTASCTFHARLLQNLIFVLAQKNLLLTQKLEHTSKRTTRDKLLSYLSAESIKAGCATFSIPFNRQELADYLGVDRSAMSSALCKLRDEGILEFQKNQFALTHSVQP